PGDGRQGALPCGHRPDGIAGPRRRAHALGHDDRAGHLVEPPDRADQSARARLDDIQVRLHQPDFPGPVRLPSVWLESATKEKVKTSMSELPTTPERPKTEQGAPEITFFFDQLRANEDLVK